MHPANKQLLKFAGGSLGAIVLVLEAYDVLSPPLEPAAWIYWLLVVLAVGCFPLVLVAGIQWIRRDPDVETAPWMDRAPRALMVSTVGLVVVGGGWLGYWVVAAEGGVRDREAALDGPSLAVMPFRNQSPDPNDAFFAQGLTDELTRVFVDVPGLRVMAGAAAAPAAMVEGAGALEVARALGVRTVLEGSVSKSGDRIRVSAQLLRGEDAHILWSERYDREMGDVFALQDDLSASIVRALSPTVAQTKSGPGGASPSRDWGTESPEAYLDYLRGRGLAQTGAPGDRAEAAAAFLSALEADPEFERAREALESVAPAGAGSGR